MAAPVIKKSVTVECRGAGAVGASSLGGGLFAWRDDDFESGSDGPGGSVCDFDDQPSPFKVIVSFCIQIIITEKLTFVILLSN